MRRVFGLRFLVEAAFIVLVAVLVWYEDVSKAGIVAAIVGAWAVVAAAEWGMSRRGRELQRPVVQAEPPEAARVFEPELAPESRHVRLVAPEPAAQPAVRVSGPVEGVPGEPGGPPGDAEPEPEPPAAQVVQLPARPGPPREWNVWDLERMARESAGSDAARDEERAFLLMYLREFADPDGLLPVTFDSLVRETFADVLGTARP